MAHHISSDTCSFQIWIAWDKHEVEAVQRLRMAMFPLQWCIFSFSPYTTEFFNSKMLQKPGLTDILEQTDMRLFCILEMLTENAHIPFFEHMLRHSTELSGCTLKTSHLKEISSYVPRLCGADPLVIWPPPRLTKIKAAQDLVYGARIFRDNS